MSTQASTGKEPKYLASAGWGHIFSGTREETTRWIYDCTNELLVAAQIDRAWRGWSHLDPVEMADLLESIHDNDAPGNRGEFDLLSFDALPSWQEVERAHILAQALEPDASLLTDKGPVGAATADAATADSGSKGEPKRLLYEVNAFSEGDDCDLGVVAPTTAQFSITEDDARDIVALSNLVIQNRLNLIERLDARTTWLWESLWVDRHGNETRDAALRRRVESVDDSLVVTAYDFRFDAVIENTSIKIGSEPLPVAGLKDWLAELDAGKVDAPTEGAKKPRVLIVVNGGIADWVCDEGVDVELFDRDNWDDAPEDREGVSPHFLDLALTAGVPVCRADGLVPSQTSSSTVDRPRTA